MFLQPQTEYSKQSIKTPVKWAQTEKSDIYFCVNFDCYCQSLTFDVCTQIWDFSNIFEFPKMLSLSRKATLEAARILSLLN